MYRVEPLAVGCPLGTKLTSSVEKSRQTYVNIAFRVNHNNKRDTLLAHLLKQCLILAAKEAVSTTKSVKSERTIAGSVPAMSSEMKWRNPAESLRAESASEGSVRTRQL